METLRIFNENYQQIGEMSREEVHWTGTWHETFHLWILTVEEDKEYIHFQVRSQSKKDFPGLLDITSAGHLLASEKKEDGLREVREEIGLLLELQELDYIGLLNDELLLEDFQDREMCHTYFYRAAAEIWVSYRFNEEVQGMVKIEKKAFRQLWQGEINKIEGTSLSHKGDESDGKSVSLTKRDFVPHSDSYMRRVLNAI
ncbi:NUDIX hydrolase [Alkalicoccus daliensis]|uniref:Isopentenyldiphosphate isomerase n=1 Tax=Alkalicoccus daliensis TaxID=745820 RepID=A0A1H0HT48_9BACI|nr:NUDIX domain-containing protein [Alkalicoccus daliensis]SDO22308.1 Isopentenyldiphosphate isomerase [Alkalicoccus daliensis]